MRPLEEIRVVFRINGRLLFLFQKVYVQQRNSNIFFLADRVQTLASCKSKFILFLRLFSNFIWDVWLHTVLFTL